MHRTIVTIAMAVFAAALFTVVMGWIASSPVVLLPGQVD